LLPNRRGGVTNLFAQKFEPKYLREQDKSLLALTTNATSDGWLEFKAEAIDAASFATRFAKAIGMGEGYSLQLVRDRTDVKETRHQHYQLYYKNVLVEGSHLTLHSRNGKLTAAHSRIIEDLNIVVDKPIIESKALEMALTDRKLSTDKLKDKKTPKGQLVLTSMNNDYNKSSYRFAYTFDVYSQDDLEASRIYVDATSGIVLKKVSLRSACFSHHSASHAESVASDKAPLAKSISSATAPKLAATFNSLYPRGNPTPTFEVEAASPNGFQLTMSTNMAQALRTRRDVNNNLVWDDPEITNGSLTWGNTEQHATLAHWVTWRSYQYFLNRFGMNGTNGQGAIADVFIAPAYDEGASWTYATRMMRIGQVGNNILSTVDIVGHEYGHGVSHHLVGGWLHGNGENIALSEGFSDIIGSIMERELLPNGGGPNEDWYWQMGENAFYVRNMANPTLRNHPWTYQQPGFWDFSLNDVHRNAGVLNKWFHTLTTGKTPNGDIAHISFEDAVSVVYWGLENYIYGDYNYPNAANALRMAAGAVFGECSPQQRAVAAAWGAVGLPTTYVCSPDCNFAATSFTPTSVACNQAITLNTGCTVGSSGYSNGWTCQGVTYSYSGPNVPYNSSYSTSLNVTAPSTSGNYQYSLAMSKPSSGCYTPTYTFNVNVNCGSTANCDFSSGPRYVGTWNGVNVQIRQISGKNVLVTAIVGASNDKYYPRGDNFWGSFNLDPGAAGLQSCLNAGSTGWGGLSAPGTIAPPAGYYQGTEPDGAVFYAQNGSNPPNPCDMSTPRHVGTWNGLNVQIRQFPNNKRGLVTAIPGASNDKFYPRGDNFWDNFTKVAGADQYRPCLNAGDTGWWGLSFPSGITPSSGYQQGTEPDGAVFFSTNGLRVGVAEPTREDVSLVKIRPNPVQHELTVTFSLKEAGDVQVRLLDLQGRIQQNHTYKGNAGQNERVLNVASLPTGTYVLDVLLEQQRIVHKVLKQ
jgi:Zn-dependent metalloprotease